MKTKLGNILLLITFFLTIMAPLTGMVVHKLASTAFLLLCLIHVIRYKNGMNGKRYLALALIVLAFVSGIFALIYEEVALVVAIHKALSIITVFSMAIHIFVFHRRMLGKIVRQNPGKEHLG